ncbi:MAG: response regulator, partial [Magnetococcales bacterium]|nr:response regulator [Magnetococcales bacterium]
QMVRVIALNRPNRGRYALIQVEDITHTVIREQKLRQQTQEIELREQELLVSQELALRASKSKGEFLANMSHEIRTPLNAILGMGSLLAESSLSREQYDHLKVLTHASDGLMGLINDILDLSKIEAGQLSLESIPFDLHALIYKVLEIFQFKVKLKQVNLEVRIDEATPQFVIGDPQRLKQIVLNLVGNALKFTERGEVILALEAAGQEQVTFSVQDSGIGIPAERLEQIFSPFQQADSSVTRRYGGTGLGLTICRHLVETMDGALAAESRVGVGSRFYFTVRLPVIKATPLTEPSLRTRQERPLDGAALSDSHSRRILLVDDSEDNRLLIEAYLRKTDHHLVSVSNGAEAVERFMSESFDIVLMDIQMPVMDGITATRKIRNWEREQSSDPTPIIALTAHAMKKDMERSLKAGCDLHLTKPLKKHRLMDVIQKY